MKLLLAVLLPALSSALTGSHVQVSVGGATYQHGAPIGQQPTPTTYHQPAPVYPTQAHTYHKPTTQYHTAAPVYHTAKKQNCSVVDEVVKAKVCTPAFETKCDS